MIVECPNCQKAYLICDEVVDTEWFEDSYYDTCIGHCPDCGKDYEWVERYRFVEIQDLKPLNK